MAGGTQQQEISFLCNICGQQQFAPEDQFGRETPNCKSCGSTVRYRALIYHLAVSLFGQNIPLTAFPGNRSIRGLGFSDWPGLAKPLAEKLDYTNTFYDREPRLDLKNVPGSMQGRYDFLICSEVLEHVSPPVKPAVEGLCSLLKPGGTVVCTVPYQVATGTAEHFPDLHDFGVFELSGVPILVNRCKNGALQVHENLVFHGGVGSTLEMRIFGQHDLLQLFQEGGFESAEIADKEVAETGIFYPCAWSLPILARKRTAP